jgi:hypothetical protein
MMFDGPEGGNSSARFGSGVEGMTLWAWTDDPDADRFE